MLFNSHLFLFVFFPIFLSLFYLIRFSKNEYKKNLFIILILCSSIFFYGYWNIKYLFILILSVLFNYIILNLKFKNNKKYLKVIFAIFFNLGLLFYFKYFPSIFGFINGYKVDYNSIVIPLGISFFTFQQLGYIIDSNVNNKKKSFLEYASFVVFFPQLIAGPILRAEEYFPKIYDCIKDKKVMNNLLIGLVIFVIGLSKKLLIADQIALYIDPYFSLDPAQLKVSTLESWFAAIGYIFQLYFDFSGYSDMAVGICKCIGLNIPYNFDSPLKKKSIQAFWNTWHITLTRFTTNYIFNSLVIFLNKFKLNLNLIIISSSMLTFILIGVWHGSGLNFLIFGLIHGFAYQINRFFIYIINDFQLNFFKIKYFDIFYWIITFIVIVVSFVFFRSPNLEISLAIVSNMFNFSNIIIPNLFSKVSVINEIFELIGFKFGSFSFFTDFSFVLLLTTCFVLLIFFPNTKEISILFENDLMNDKSSKKYSIIKLAIFSIFIGTILISSLFSLRNYNVFLYYQF